VFKLIPTDEKFFEMFQKQAEYLVKGAAMVRDIAEGKLTIKGGAEKLSALESEADSLTHEIFVRLDRSFITPIDREDIHGLALALDDCMDLLEAAVDHLDLYSITVIPQAVKSMAEYLEAQAAQVHQLTMSLDKMAWEGIRPHCIEINRLENEADRVTRQAIAGLFQGGMDALEVMKWRDIYNLFEEATDKCEDVAGIVEGIALKNG
jgi:hypothetical protein